MTSPIAPASCAEKNSRPSGCAMIARAPQFGPPIGYSPITSPCGDMRPILLAKFSVNHNSPSGATVTPRGEASGVRTGELDDLPVRVDVEAPDLAGPAFTEPELPVGSDHDDIGLGIGGRDRMQQDLDVRRNGRPACAVVHRPLPRRRLSFRRSYTGLPARVPAPRGMGRLNSARPGDRAAPTRRRTRRAPFRMLAQVFAACFAEALDLALDLGLGFARGLGRCLLRRRAFLRLFAAPARRRGAAAAARHQQKGFFRSRQNRFGDIAEIERVARPAADPHHDQVVPAGRLAQDRLVRGQVHAHGRAQRHLIAIGHVDDVLQDGLLLQARSRPAISAVLDLGASPIARRRGRSFAPRSRARAPPRLRRRVAMARCR